MAITKASAQTTVNSGVTAAAAATVNQITTAPASATVVAGGGTLGGVTISNVAITDSTFANVLSGDTAVSSAGGFVRITGTGFKTNANVFLGSTLLANTFVDSTRINANIPASAAGTYQFTVFNTDGSGAISPAGLLISGPPSWTSTSYSSGSLTLGIQLLASGDAPLTYYIQPGSANPQNLAVNSTGFLSGTVSSDGAYTVTVVVDDAQGQSTQADITTTVTLNDPYFNLTVLALPADAAANVWITDASTNNFNLTVNGDTRPTAFSPYDTVWSNYFDGTGDYLTVPANAAFNFGTDDYTIEGWINVTTTTWTLYATGGSGSSDQFVCDSGTLYWGFGGSFGGGTASYFTSADLNTWTHVAVSRSSGTTRIFKNGLVMATSATVAAIGSSVNTLQIGRRSDGFYFTTGWMSNIRVLKGTGLYTGAFTPSTSPLTAIANTSLLTCQSNRLIDNSTNNFTITKNGDVSVSNFAPLVETNATTGSAYFDGTGDYLRKSGSGVLIANNDVTIECWIYPFSTNIVGLFDGGPNEVNIIRSFGTNKISKQGQEASGASFTVIANVWQHFACTFSSGNIRTYINGVLSGTGTYTSGYAAGSNFDIGGINATGDGAFNGYISDFRVTNSVLYTATFTPPTSPLSAVANTSLLTLQYPVGENNHRFVDSSGFNHLVTRNGNATQGTYSPFSQTGWSNYFDGSSAVRYTGSPISTSQSNLTIEAWVFPTVNPTFGGGVAQVVVDANGEAGGSYWGFGLSASRNVVWRWYDGASGFNTTSVATVPLNEWSHIAVSVNSNTIRIFINGTLQSVTGTSTLTNRGGNTGFVNIGRYATTDAFIGYISNARLIAGTGLYTSSFTPSTTPLTAITNTSLLSCQSNRLIDNSTNNRVITTYGSPSVQPFGPFAPDAEYSAATNGGSAYFDGTGDNLTQASGQQVSFGTGNFTIEAWIYWTTSIASESAIMWGNGVGWTLYVFPANRLQWGTTGPQTPANLLTGNTALTIGRWYHIAVTRSGTTVTLWVNGVSDGTVTDSANYSANGTLDVGISHSSNRFTGYMSGVRVVKGTAVYTSTFTPPTAPPTPIVNTSLLLNFTNAGITDATGKNVLETANQTRLSTADKKYGTGSILFDGTDDYVVMPYSENYTFATGPFTIECWVKFNTLSGNRLIFDTYTSAATGGGYQLYWRGTGTSIAFYANGGVQAQSSFTGHATGTWYHVAVTRNTAGTLQIFIDGVSYASVSYATAIDIAASARPAIGIQFTTLTNDLDGYIDDLRVTKGFARYTANFAPPTDTLKLR